MSSLTESQVQQALKSVIDPEIGRSLAELNMVKQVQCTPTGVKLQIELPTPAYPDSERITERIRETLPAGTNVQVEYTWNVKGKQTGGKIGLRIKNVVAVGSGKGGVGKSTIAASLAVVRS